MLRILTDKIGKHAAQHVVYEATMAGIEQGVALATALQRHPTITEALTDAELAAVLDAHSALSASGAFVDRVLAAATRATPR